GGECNACREEPQTKHEVRCEPATQKGIFKAHCSGLAPCLAPQPSCQIIARPPTCPWRERHGRRSREYRSEARPHSSRILRYGILRKAPAPLLLLMASATTSAIWWSSQSRWARSVTAPASSGPAAPTRC